MKYVRLGKTNLIVSRVAFGTWQLGGDWGATDADAAVAAIRRAADGGVNLFDTAQAYGFGASEELLATALAGRPRHELVIATKGGLRKEGGGVVRDSSPAWIRGGVFRRDIEAEVLPYTRASDIGVLVYGPLAHGLLGGHMSSTTRFAPDDWRAASPVFAGEALATNLEKVAELVALAEGDLGVTVSQLALAWDLSHPGVDVAIVGTRDPAHVDQALAAGDLELDRSALVRITEIIHGVVPVGCPSPERARSTP